MKHKAAFGGNQRRRSTLHALRAKFSGICGLSIQVFRSREQDRRDFFQ